MIPEIDIWRAASLMLRLYGDEALAESAILVAEHAARVDHQGEALWRRITDAIEQLVNTTPPGRCTDDIAQFREVSAAGRVPATARSEAARRIAPFGGDRRHAFSSTSGSLQ